MRLDTMARKLLGERIPNVESAKIPYAQVVADEKFNPRSITYDLPRNRDKDQSGQDGGTIDELAADIHNRGLLSPLAVLRQKDGTYFLVAGFRRHRALNVLRQKYPKNGYDFVQVQILDDGGIKDEKDRMTLGRLTNIAENFHRNNYHASEFAEACLRIKTESGWEGIKIAQHMSISKQHVNNLIGILENVDSSILGEWRKAHPMATLGELIKLKSLTKDEQLKVWEAHLIEKNYKAKPSAIDGDNAGDTTAEATVQGPKRKSALKYGQIEDLLTAVKRSERSADWKAGAFEVLRVVLCKSDKIADVWPVVEEATEEGEEKVKGKKGKKGNKKK